MPYVKKERRYDLNREGLQNVAATISTVGELNFAICRLCCTYLFGGQEDPSYKDYNEVIGVLECAKLEIYRRLVAVYEDRKMEENGDVIDPDAEPPQ